MMRIISLAVISLGLLSANAGVSLGETCIECHGDGEKMRSAGYPQYAFSVKDVREQTRMPASCADCHLGDPLAPDKDLAHRGLLAVMAVDGKWNAVTREKMKAQDLEGWTPLLPRGSNRATQLLPKRSSQGRVTESPEFKYLLWHDKNPETLAFNPVISEKTCGRCHLEIVRSFLKSPMGGGSGAHTQSQYKSWTGKTGPQSCGLWNADTEGPEQGRFTEANRAFFNRHSTLPLSLKQAYDNQRGCNRCHVGCIDCHVDVAKSDVTEGKKGPHVFTKRPPSLSCYGGGRAFICHAGPLERRRGDGYLRAEFTQAAEDGIKTLNERPDIHSQRNVRCVDCHEPNRRTGFHADLRRDVRCGKCHEALARDHRRGVHRRVDCASCHTALIGGYAFNFWSAYGPPGSENPLTRFQDYQVGAIPPLIIRNPKGVWIPVHVVPHTSGNVRAEEVRVSKRLLFRNRPDSEINRSYFSNDSYAVTGVVKGLDEKDRDTMVWLNLDRVAHATGRSRGCSECHDSRSQDIKVRYGGGSYKDVEDGEYTIVADEQGLRITDFRGPGGGPVPSGLEPFTGKWVLKGNFSMPPVRNRKLYDRMNNDYRQGRFVH